MKTRLVIDSTVDLCEETRKHFTVVPLSIHFGDKTYTDTVDITHRRFYEMLIESDVLPTTSQPSPEAFREVFAQAEKADEEVVVLTISQKLSGTYQSAGIAAADFPGRVHLVDSQSVAIGAGILAEYALGLCQAGQSAQQVRAALEKARGYVKVIAMLDTLEYLKRGGRISKTAASLGGLLSIKPVISLEDGEIKILGKARGSRMANNLLIEQIRLAGGVDFSRPILLGYTGLSDALLEKYKEDSASLWEGHTDSLKSTAIGSVVGTHAGPGAVAVAFFCPQTEA